MILLREPGRDLCCWCARPATMRVVGTWFCRDHHERGVEYLAKRVGVLRAALVEPEPVVVEPEPVVVEAVAAPSVPRRRRERGQPVRVDRSALRMLSDKDLREIAAGALERGWIVRRTGGDHIMLVHHSGARVVTSGTRGSRGRGAANLRAALARAERGA